MAWTAEKRKAAGERLKAARAAKRGAAVEVAEPPKSPETLPYPSGYTKPDPNDPRLARLRAVQAQTIASDAEASAIVAERETAVGQGWYDVRIDGNKQMAIVNRPCWCGAGKREWHGVH